MSDRPPEPDSDGDHDLVENLTPQPLHGPGKKEAPHKGGVVEADWVRAWVTFFLLGLVAVLALIGVASAFVDDAAKHMIEVMKIVFSPIITLAAGATGYYFGGKSRR